MHPSLRELCTRPTDPRCSVEEIRFDAVRQLLRSFHYMNVTGHEPLGRVIEERAGNCLSLVCVCVSIMRRGGMAATAVFGIIASPRELFPLIVHAYVVVRTDTDGELLLIDPETGDPHRTSVVRVFDDYRVFVVFNDAVQAASADEMRRLLATGTA
ncbi:MAG: hypothetical protein WBC51_21135 [Vicinamibacterales bacterium]